MSNENIFLLRYSGIDLRDYEPQWLKKYAHIFCKTCNSMLEGAPKIDIEITGNIPKNSGMFFIGHSLIPIIISQNLFNAIPDAGDFL